MNNNITDAFDNSIDEDEIKKFDRMADEWWDPYGKFKPLHIMNPYRIDYIKEKISLYFDKDINDLKLFENINFLDIGCGGGLISEAIARLGGNIKAIDANEKTIKIAKSHLKKSNVSVDYAHASVDDIVDAKEAFDVVLALEIVEHVADIQHFITQCSKVLKPNGVIFISTLNRTLKSYMLAIVGAEYILRWLPIGTHEWKKFIKPSELMVYCANANLKMNALDGMVYNPFTQHWKITTSDLEVNYISQFQK